MFANHNLDTLLRMHYYASVENEHVDRQLQYYLTHRDARGTKYMHSVKWTIDALEQYPGRDMRPDSIY
jgi:hypothetical protein